jgi:hypothetical protein
MCKILLLNLLLVVLTLLIIFSYIYHLLIKKTDIKRQTINKLVEDKMLYNLDCLKAKLFFANILKDDSILCANDDINKKHLFKKKYNLHNNINYNKYDNHFKYIKEDEEKLIKKILMLNANNPII